MKPSGWFPRALTITFHAVQGQAFGRLSLSHLRTASGVLVLNILASVGQQERGVISERTKDALAHQKANRERIGGAPYGRQLACDGVHLDAMRRSKRSSRLRTSRRSGAVPAADRA